MNQFAFRLRHDGAPLQEWKEAALTLCRESAPLPGSPGEIGDSTFHFFFPGSIRGVAVLQTDENEFSMGLGPFSSDDDIRRVSGLLEDALARGLTIEVSETTAEDSEGESPPSLLHLFFPDPGALYEYGDPGQLTAIDDRFQSLTKEACWRDFSDPEDPDESAWVDIVDHTYAIELTPALLVQPQAAVEEFMISQVRETLDSPTRVLINDYSEVWRQGLGMMVISDYEGQACHISLRCSHVYLHELDPRFWGKLISMKHLYGLLKDRARVMGTSLYIPAVLGPDQEEWFRKFEEVATELPPLV
jgi:hypothetical protein